MPFLPNEILNHIVSFLAEEPRVGLACKSFAQFYVENFLEKKPIESISLFKFCHSQIPVSIFYENWRTHESWLMDIFSSFLNNKISAFNTSVLYFNSWQLGYYESYVSLDWLGWLGIALYSENALKLALKIPDLFLNVLLSRTIQHAKSTDQIPIVRVAIEKGLLNSEGILSVMEHAATFGHIPTVKKLIENGLLSNIPSHHLNKRIMLNVCANGHLEILKMLFEGDFGCIANVEDSTALMLAAQEGHLSIVQYLLENPAALPRCQPNIADSEILMRACVGGHLDVVKYLLESDYALPRCDPSAADSCALRDAAYKGHFHVVQYLVEGPYDAPRPNPTDQHNGALVSAATAESAEIMQYLLESPRALPRCELDLKNSCILEIILEGRSLSVAKYLVLQQKAQLSKVIESRCMGPLLKQFAQAGDVEAVTAMIDIIKDNCINQSQRYIDIITSAFNAACEVGSLDVIKLFLSYFFDWQRLPLTEAIHPQVIQYLISQSNCSIKFSDVFLASALKGHVDSLMHLLNVPEGLAEIQTILQKTLLQVSTHCQLNSLILIIESDLVSLTSEIQFDYQQALHLTIEADKLKNLDIIRYLIESPYIRPRVMPNINNSELLFRAIRNENLSAVRYLLEHPRAVPRCIVNPPNRDHALIAAIKIGCLSIVKYLCKSNCALPKPCISQNLLRDLRRKCHLDDVEQCIQYTMLFAID